MTTAKKTGKTAATKKIANVKDVFAPKGHETAIDIKSVTLDELRAIGARNGMLDDEICAAVARIRGG